MSRTAPRRFLESAIISAHTPKLWKVSTGFFPCVLRWFDVSLFVDLTPSIDIILNSRHILTMSLYIRRACARLPQPLAHRLLDVKAVRPPGVGDPAGKQKPLDFFHSPGVDVIEV
jgi:hypothetical protein